MKILTTIAILATSFALTACSSNVATNADILKPAMKDAKMMDGKDAMKDAKMMDGKHAMKDAKMMDGKHAKKDTMMKADSMKDTKMMKGDSCHNHSANSMTKSASHCHKSSKANHSHKYGG